MTAEIVDFPDRRNIAEEAAEWLIRLDSDKELSPEESVSLQEWIARSPAHREELFMTANLWGNMNVLTELAVPLGDTSTGGKAFIAGLYGKLISPSLGAIAATCCAVVMTVAYFLWSQSAPMFESNGVYVTKVGEQRAIELGDGSVILLNTDSEILVDYRRNFRDIRLVKGEAAFDVASHPERPFRVFAGNERVEAVGTAFTVYLQDDKIDVTVTEGRVALATLSQPQNSVVAERSNRSDSPNSSLTVLARNEDYVETLSTLIAGQSARIQMQDINVAASTTSIIENVATVEEQDIARKLSWREGLLTFAGASLEDVVREISRYTTMSIEITDPAVRATKIGGTFPVGETDLLLVTLETNFGLRVTRLSPDHVLLSSALP